MTLDPQPLSARFRVWLSVILENWAERLVPTIRVKPTPDQVNEDLARDLVERLNALCHDENALHAIAWLIQNRVAVLPPLCSHPTVQVDTAADGTPVVGFLGILNGLVGVRPTGDRAGWGYIAAVFDGIRPGVPFDPERNYPGGERPLRLIGFDLVDEDGPAASVAADEIPYSIDPAKALP